MSNLSHLNNTKEYICIGEIGLDFYRDLSPREIQVEAFKSQLELAIETNLPIVIHTRESFAETVAVVRNYASRLKGGVFHCFPGNVEDAFQGFAHGLFLTPAR